MMLKKQYKRKLRDLENFLDRLKTTQKQRIEYSFYVPCHLVHNAMVDIDPDSNAARQVNNKIKKRKQRFTSERPLRVVSLNGHDKFCGYQNSTFTLAFYDYLDTLPRITFSSVFQNLSQRVSKKILKYQNESNLLPHFKGVDRGTEIRKMCSIQVFLSRRLFSFDNPLH